MSVKIINPDNTQDYYRDIVTSQYCQISVSFLLVYDMGEVVPARVREVEN